MNREREVVVTGIGVISSIGIGVDEFWKNCLAGQSGISRVQSFDVSDYQRDHAGEIHNFDEWRYLSKRRAKLWGRSARLAVSAGMLAMEDAGLSIKSPQFDPQRFGVVMGTTAGEFNLMEEFNSAVKDHPDDVSVEKIGLFSTNILSSSLAMKFYCHGPNMVLSNACAAGNYSIGLGLDYIRSGRADMMMVGGSDGFSRIVFTGFCRLHSVADKICRPFDRDRTGMIPAEGAGILILEEKQKALARGAKCYAHVRGYGLSCDAEHMTHPNPVGVSQAINKALHNAKVDPSDIHYVNAHGTGTHENDRNEYAALNRVFKDKLKDIPVSSTKSMLGHTMGAASAIESIVCCLSLRDQVLSPTINFQTPDPECPLDCVPNEARSHRLRYALNNSLAFGGNNCAVVYQEGYDKK